MELKKIEDKLILSEGEKTIEEYSFSKEINFSLLMDDLLKRDMAEPILLSIVDENFNDDDKNVSIIIKNLIDNYNKKVDEIKAFKESLADEERKWLWNNKRLMNKLIVPPLYSFIGYLLENNQTGRNLHLTFSDIANNKIIDKDIVGRDGFDSIIFSDGSKISCGAITRDMCYGFKLEIK